MRFQAGFYAALVSVKTLAMWLLQQNDTDASGGQIVLEKLQELERIARQLDPGHDERSSMLKQVQEYSESFLQQLKTKAAYRKDPGTEGFSAVAIDDRPSELAELLEFFATEVDRPGINTVSSGNFGYIPGGGLYPSALGDYLADVSNRYSGVSFAGPGAARLELSLVKWMCDLVGYPDSAAGDHTSGGSMATLSALVTARDARGIGIGNIPASCVYLTSQAHHCISKALHIAGLKDIRKRIVGMDRKYRMDTVALEQMIEADRARGLNPWLIIASAGTTDTGAVDPIADIARIAGQYGLWFHVDAAYGGFFLLCDPGRERMQGIELADSIVLDPHKGLSLPYGSGAVLIRDGLLLAKSNSYYANYMQDARRAEPDVNSIESPSDLSLELTRPFRAPRMWFPLKLFGLKPFRASLEEKMWLARYFHQQLSGVQGFEVGPFPDLSIVTFRYLPGSDDANAFNKRLLEAILEDGRVFMSTTMIDGNYTLRLAVLNFRTHRKDIDSLLKLLQTKALELEKD